MDRDHFIISVYCLVCEHYQVLAKQHRLRHAGFAPALTDEEVITLELCGEYFKLSADKDIFAYFRAHWAHFFPALVERTSFVRQAANLAPLKAAMQQRLAFISGQADDPVQSVDTLPLPVCVYTRSRRDRCFKPMADYGHCPAKQMDDYGFKLGLRLSRCGMITAFCLLPARPHDIHLLGDLVEGFAGTIAADKGFIDDFRHKLLWQRSGLEIMTPRRKNMKDKLTPPQQVRQRLCARWRKKIETVGSHLTERFAVARIRVHDLWHFEHRLVRKVLAHTVAVFLNLQGGREPLDLDGLVPA